MNISKLNIIYEDKSLVDISFNIDSSLALVGQSGSGKSLTLKAFLNMLPNGMELDLKYDSDFELIVGESLSFVPQNPFTALSPLTKIQDQFFTNKDEMDKLFSRVGLDSDLSSRFPPELSGGQLQRVVIAMALSTKPKLLLLDEPTTALDPQTRVLIIELLKSLQKEYSFKILFVTHDIESVSSLCDDICIIKNGKVVESGDMESILKKPQKSYTKTLIEASFAHRKFRQ